MSGLYYLLVCSSSQLLMRRRTFLFITYRMLFLLTLCLLPQQTFFYLLLRVMLHVISFSLLSIRVYSLLTVIIMQSWYSIPCAFFLTLYYLLRLLITSYNILFQLFSSIASCLRLLHITNYFVTYSPVPLFLLSIIQYQLLYIVHCLLLLNIWILFFLSKRSGSVYLFYIQILT